MSDTTSDMEVGSNDGFEFVDLPNSTPIPEPDSQEQPPSKKSRASDSETSDTEAETGSPASEAPVAKEVAVAAPMPKKNYFVDFSLPRGTLDEFTPAQFARIFPNANAAAQIAAAMDEDEGKGLENPFVSKMKEHAAKSVTENRSPSFNTTGDSRLDFFFKVMEKTPKEQTVELFQTSWIKEPLDTLKLLAYLRDCRGGKGIRNPFQVCLFWLYENHPKTLEKNLEQLSSFGYWKDLLHFLMTIAFQGVLPHYLELDDSFGLKKVKKMDNRRKEAAIKDLDQKRENKQLRSQNFHRGSLGHTPQTRTKGGKTFATRREMRKTLKLCKWDLRAKGTYNRLVLEYFQKQDESLYPKISRAEFLTRCQRKDMLLKFARDRLSNDDKYRFFHIKIAQLFAQQLKLDKEMVNGKSTKRISLAAKWAPSLMNHFDKFTLIGTTIALELMKAEGHVFKMDKPCNAVQAFLSRQRYHKEYLIKLREILKVPETLMSAGKWNKVDYRRVPALCMRLNNPQFLKHDRARFENFIQGKKKIAGATMKPVQIIAELMELSGNSQKTEIELLEKQWASMVESIKGRGKSKTLSNALAICDVSGSMEGEPMEAAVGLTLLTMDLNSKPWNEMCLTFHENPSILQVSNTLSLHQKVKKILGMDCGLNTNLNKVFDLILILASEVREEYGDQGGSLPSTILVFTDMEFDEAFPGTTQTNFEALKEKFTKAGFQLPRIVFWNLRGGCAYCAASGVTPEQCEFCKGVSRSIPVKKDEQGTILMSGYSGQQLKLISENQDVDEMDPLGMMLKAIGQEKYNKLKVFD